MTSNTAWLVVAVAFHSWVAVLTAIIWKNHFRDRWRLRLVEHHLDCGWTASYYGGNGRWLSYSRPGYAFRSEKDAEREMAHLILQNPSWLGCIEIVKE